MTLWSNNNSNHVFDYVHYVCRYTYVCSYVLQKAHVLKTWSPAGGAIERRVYTEGIKFCSGSFHWWIHSWMSLGVRAFAGEVYHWGHAFKECILSLNPSLFSLSASWLPDVSSFALYALSAVMFCFVSGLKWWGPVTMDWNLKLSVKINLPSIKLFISGMLSQQWKLRYRGCI